MPGADSCSRLCPWCHQVTSPVWVHGHAQCEHCRINIDPCCAGDETIPARVDRDQSK